MQNSQFIIMITVVIHNAEFIIHNYTVVIHNAEFIIHNYDYC